MGAANAPAGMTALRESEASGRNFVAAPVRAADVERLPRAEDRSPPPVVTAFLADATLAALSQVGVDRRAGGMTATSRLHNSMASEMPEFPANEGPAAWREFVPPGKVPGCWIRRGSGQSGTTLPVRGGTRARAGPWKTWIRIPGNRRRGQNPPVTQGKHAGMLARHLVRVALPGKRQSMRGRPKGSPPG